MLWETISVVRDLPRLHEIATVMIRYGWGDLVRILGISGVLERAGRVLHWQSTSEISAMTSSVEAELGSSLRRKLEALALIINRLISQITNENRFPLRRISCRP